LTLGEVKIFVAAFYDRWYHDRESHDQREATMVKAHEQYWTVESEKAFISRLGTFSDPGKVAGRKACLEGYISALKSGDTQCQWTKGECLDLLNHAGFCLMTEKG
jgi:hypothetical protein